MAFKGNWLVSLRHTRTRKKSSANGIFTQRLVSVTLWYGDFPLAIRVCDQIVIPCSAQIPTVPLPSPSSLIPKSAIVLASATDQEFWLVAAFCAVSKIKGKALPERGTWQLLRLPVVQAETIAALKKRMPSGSLFMQPLRQTWWVTANNHLISNTLGQEVASHYIVSSSLCEST